VTGFRVRAASLRGPGCGLALLLLAGLVLAGTACAQARVADAQLTGLGESSFVLRIRSTGPQAFDVVPGARADQVRVRLYRVVLGDLPALSAAPSGSIRFVAERAGHVLVVLDLGPGYRAQVRQGGNPHVVEVTIER